MAFIQKQDTNGTKATLLKGELGYDDYTAGGDTGRVYVGNGTTNIPLATLNDSLGVGEFISTSIAISSDGTALANDNGTANNNVGIGANCLATATTAEECVAIGTSAGLATTSSNSLTAVGAYSGYSNTTGGYNSFYGVSGNAASKLTGSHNTGVGYETGYNLTTGQYNVLMGYQAGYSLTTSSYNVAIGYKALFAPTSAAAANTAVGSFAGAGITTGVNNSLFGHSASQSLTSGDSNTSIGTSSGTTITTGSGNISIGYLSRPSVGTASNECTLGYTSITTLRCNDTSISSLSDGRDKTDVRDSEFGLDYINAVRPVNFLWESRDGNAKDGTREVGFIAQELLEVETRLNGKDLKTVQTNNPDRLEADYGKLLVVAVKAIQELSAKVDSLESELNTLKGL